MRRLVALAFVVGLVASACAGDDDDDAASAPPTTITTVAETSTTTTTIERVALDESCTGIGSLTGDAELTWLAGDQVVTAPVGAAEPRCIATYAGPPSLEWGGDGDRLLLGARSILVGDGALDLVPDGSSVASWSRPSGRAVVVRDGGGELRKLSLVGEPEVGLGLPFTDGEVLYHPSGTAIALVSHQPSSSAPPDLLLSSNTGSDVRWLVSTETADAIDHLAFTADGAIVFAATHDDRTHVHRLVLGSETLDTLLDSPAPISTIVASPWADDLVAAGRGECGAPEPLWLLGDEAAEIDGTPVGWLPDGSLVVLEHDDGCDDQPGDLYVIADGEPTLVAEDVDAAAVRAVLPPPLAPPPEIEAAPA